MKPYMPGEVDKQREWHRGLPQDSISRVLVRVSLQLSTSMFLHGPTQGWGSSDGTQAPA